MDQRPASTHVASHLGIPQGAPVIYRLQHMYAGQQIGQLQETWLPLTLAEAETLSLDLGSPVLAIDRITHGQDGHALALAQAVIAGDRVQLHYNQTFPAVADK